MFGETQGYAQGGEVSRMTKMYNQGGQVDPVSGNEVPPGVGPEAVRDDVKANLSEGEYVVPADVVKYFGVAHFEKLRDKAKEGMQEFSSAGRIGGEAPKEDMGMAEGGLVPGKSDFDPSQYGMGFSISDAVTTPSAQAPVAAPVCPDGYSWDEGSQVCMPVAPASSMGSSGSSTSSRGVTPGATPSNPNSWMEKFSYDDPDKLFSQTMASIGGEDTTEDSEENGGLMSSIIGGATSLLAGGLAGGLLGKFMSTTNSARAAANASVLRATHPELADQIDAQNASYVKSQGIENVPEAWRNGTTLSSNLNEAKGDLISAWSTPTATSAQTSAAPASSGDPGEPTRIESGQSTGVGAPGSGKGEATPYTGVREKPLGRLPPNYPNTGPAGLGSNPTTSSANTGPAGQGSQYTTTSANTGPAGLGSKPEKRPYT